MFQPSVALSVFCGILSNVLSGTGLVFQRKAKLERSGSLDKGPLWKNKTWLIGVILQASGAPIDFISFLGASLFVLALISCCRLPYIALISTSLLGEKATRDLYAGILLCACGALLVITHLPRNSFHTYKTYSDFFTDGVIAYFVLAIITVTIIPPLLMKKILPERLMSILFPVCAALALSLEKVLNVVFNKIETASTLNYALVLGGVVFLGLFDFGINLVAVQNMQPSVFAATFFGFFNSLLVFQSVFIFQEFGDHTENLPLAVLGGALSLCGALLTRRGEEPTQEMVVVDPEDDEDESGDTSNDMEKGIGGRILPQSGHVMVEGAENENDEKE